MNIIQLQDRLKGLPEEALVKYVEQPMGEVPIYLALGELQRRSEMKKRFQASQADKPSVAEQLVAEAKPMQMGLGAMAPQQMMPGGQGVGAPQPTPEIDPRQMAASGIAANPQSAVGGTAMMKEGGIVGYAYGGSVNPKYTQSVEQVGQYVVTNKDGSKTIVNPGDPGYLTATKELSDEEKAKGYEMSEFGDVKYVAPDGLVKSSPIAQYQSPNRGQYQSFDESRRMDQAMNPKKYRDLKDANEAAKIEIAELDYLKNTGKDISIDKNKKGETEDDSAFNTVEDIDALLAGQNNNTTTNTLTRDTDFFSMLKPGTDADRNMPIEGRSIDKFKTERDRLKAAFGIKDEFYDEGKANNINMALIQAGLGIAGGTSANALENISKGSLPALEAFNKEQARLTGAQRLENLAAMNAYSEEAKEIRGYQAALLDRFFQNKAAEAARRGTDHDKAHTLTMKYLADNVPGGIPTNYPLRYGDATDDYRRIYAVFLDTVISGKPITKAQAESMKVTGGTGNQQKKSKLKLVE